MRCFVKESVELDLLCRDLDADGSGGGVSFLTGFLSALPSVLNFDCCFGIPHSVLVMFKFGDSTLKIEGVGVCRCFGVCVGEEWVPLGEKLRSFDMYVKASGVGIASY